MRVMIAAAGTGGHINPGIAIANQIKKEESNSEILFVGTGRGLENDLVPRAGYELKKINAYGVERKFTLENLKKLYRTWKSIKQAKKIIQEFQPDVVIGTGGYICIPVILAAHKMRIPTALHESNAFPGIAVKLLSKKVDTVLVGFEDAKKRLPNAKKVVVTGNPTKIQKRVFSPLEIEKKRKELGLDHHKPVVLVFGGSQGAKSINESVMEIVSQKLNQNYQIMWAVGPLQYDDVKQKLAVQNMNIEKMENAKIVPYIYQMEEVMNLVDLVVCRSGAMTITEVSIVGKPAIFIPFPFATENHQEYNAKVLESVNAARMILDKDLNAKRLNQEIKEIISEPTLLSQMAKAASRLAPVNVEQKIYQEIKKIKIEK